MEKGGGVNIQNHKRVALNPTKMAALIFRLKVKKGAEIKRQPKYTTIIYYFSSLLNQNLKLKCTKIKPKKFLCYSFMIKRQIFVSPKNVYRRSILDRTTLLTLGSLTYI